MPARHLAAELSGSGVTVNSVWPGGVRTGMLAAYRDLRPGDADPAEPARLIANLLAGQASGEVVDIHGEQGRRCAEDDPGSPVRPTCAGLAELTRTRDGPRGATGTRPR
jgi:NAD(P)-dependent dehydrogenase (short-subunit alcohol dehydrogenase family)